MKRFFKITGYILGGLLILGIIANLTGNADKPKEVPKQVVVVDKPKEDKQVEKPKAEPEKPKNEFSAEQEYINGLVVIMTDSALYMSDLSQLFMKPSVDESILLDKSWRQDIVVVYQKINEQRQKVAEIEAPAKFQKVHDLTLKGFDSIMKSRDRVLQGIDTMDVNQIIEATLLINEGSEYFNQVTEEIQKINAEIL